MPWNHMLVAYNDQDLRYEPQIGTGGMTREQAHAEVQDLLDEGGAPLRAIAESWRGGAKDDTVYAESGLMIWTIYEHPDGEDPRRAALAWLEDFAATLRSAGVTNIGIARLPD